MLEINPFVYLSCVEIFNKKGYIKNIESLKRKYKNNKNVFYSLLKILKKHQSTIYRNYVFFRNKTELSEMRDSEKKYLRQIKQMIILIKRELN